MLSSCFFEHKSKSISMMVIQLSKAVKVGNIFPSSYVTPPLSNFGGTGETVFFQVAEHWLNLEGKAVFGHSTSSLVYTLPTA